MRYLDANVFILAAVSPDPDGDAARIILRETGAGRAPAATAALTVDEVVWIIKGLQGRTKGMREGTRMLAFPNLAILDVRARHMVAALDLMEHYGGLDPRDAIHAAVAIDAGIFSIVSADPDFDAVPELTRIPLLRD